MFAEAITLVQEAVTAYRAAGDDAGSAYSLFIVAYAVNAINYARAKDDKAGLTDKLDLSALAVLARSACNQGRILCDDLGDHGAAKYIGGAFLHPGATMGKETMRLWDIHSSTLWGLNNMYDYLEKDVERGRGRVWTESFFMESIEKGMRIVQDRNARG